MNIMDDITDFVQKFKLPKYRTMVYDKDREEMREFRHQFLLEEMQEYLTAYHAGNEAGMLDAFVDMIYITGGTCIAEGWNMEQAWDRVHAANMLKKRVTDTAGGKRNSKFDVVKPIGWQHPDLGDLVGLNSMSLL